MTNRFRATIPFYRSDGIRVELSVGADNESAQFEAIEALLQAARLRGYSTDEPTVGAGDKTENVSGYVVGTYDDKKAGEFRPCVHLYPDDKRQMKIVTVYPEALHLLPFSIDGIDAFDGEAPKIDVARRRKVFHEYKMEIVIEPKKDFNGAPILSEAGNVVYKFKRAKVAQVESVAPVAVAMHPKNQEALDVLGLAIYSTDEAWAAKRAEWSKRFNDDATAILKHADATGRGCVDTLARKIGLSVDELGDVIQAATGGFTPVSELFGAQLAKVVAALVELHRNANAAPVFA